MESSRPGTAAESAANLHAKEASFHDAWAASTHVRDVNLPAQFEGVTALESRFIHQTLGDLNGRSVLEVGAGLGEASVQFARQGARVVATDLSAGMLGFGRRLARHHQVHIETVRTPGERLPFREASFDVVYVANSLHHVNDIAGTVAELHRVLKPGGTLITIDPIAYNPVINCYRRMATEVRTDDEHPLTRADVRTITAPFASARVRMFWLSSLVLFLKFYLVDRVHPNADRYWKRIYRPDVQRGIAWWFEPVAAFDRLLMTVFPPIRWWAWNVVVAARKAE
jgi:SAM-dependent methyltransferase